MELPKRYAEFEVGLHRLEDAYQVELRFTDPDSKAETSPASAHVGVQVDPEAHSLIDAERAREYLAEYFGTGRAAPRIDIYWGTTDDFLKELRDQLAAAAGETAPAAQETEDDWVTVG